MSLGIILMRRTQFFQHCCRLVRGWRVVRFLESRVPGIGLFARPCSGDHQLWSKLQYFAHISEFIIPYLARLRLWLSETELAQLNGLLICAVFTHNKKCLRALLRRLTTKYTTNKQRSAPSISPSLTHKTRGIQHKRIMPR